METNPNDSTENKPEHNKTKRSQKQMEWSRQLGMRSRELKQRKKELQDSVKKHDNEISNIETSNNETSNNSVKAIETNPCTNYILFLGGLFIVGGCAVYCKYYFKDSRVPDTSNKEEHSPVEQQVTKKLNSTLSKME